MAGVTLFGAGLVFGQGVNIDPARHPNLADAQHHIAQAMEKIDVAQKENRFDLGGHADKAKEFLVQADRELKEAAVYADHHPH
jgi:hypothetical protein